MSDPTPRPERVTLTDEERADLAYRLYDAEGFHAADSWAAESPLVRGRYEALVEAVATWPRLAAREQALREEIARQIEAEAYPFRALYDPDGHRATLHAASIVRGETR